MCGLLFSYSKSSVVSKSTFETALSLQNHRGPDKSMIEVNDTSQFMFGHNRLSIIDLSAAAEQPFRSVCGRYTLLYNGEIYNFKKLRQELISTGKKFVTYSDTEVLLLGLMEFGGSFVDRIEGMFAFVFVDNVSKVAMFGRDEGGEKPLFVRSNADGIAIASNLFSLSKITKERGLCDLSIAEYLVHGYPLGERTMHKGISSSVPGVIKLVNFLDMSISTVHIQTCDTPSYDNLFNLINTAVETTLVADVPACVSLSGGLDSSLITALASRLDMQVNTFSVVFENDKNFDESKLSRSIAKHFCTNHTEITISDFNDDDILSAFNCIDSPVIDSSIIPTFSLYRAISPHFKVVLGGDGADEIFGGYKHLKRYQLAKKLQLRRPIALLNALSVVKGRNTKLSNWGQLLSDPTQNVRRFIGSPDGLPIEYRGNFTKVSDSWFENTNSNVSYRNIVEADYENYLKRSILVKSDRCSMGHSVEARSPFLNQNIRNYRSKLEFGHDFNYRNGKLELIRIARQLFPDNYPFGYKKGFNFDLRKYLHAKKLNILWDLVFENYVDFDPNFLNNLYTLAMNKDKSGAENLVFGVALLNFWTQKIGITR